MPKIYIQGESAPIIVSREDAERIREEKNSPTHRGMIRIGTRDVQKGKIKEIRHEDDRVAKAYDLDNPMDRDTIREFEKIIDAAGDPPKPLEWYGDPHEEFVKLHPQHDIRKGFVFNPLMGLIHWSIVQWGLDHAAIARQSNGVWTIVAALRGGEKLDMTNYDEYRNKSEALAALFGRRSYAEHANRPPTFDKSVVVKSFDEPTPDPTDEINVDELFN